MLTKCVCPNCGHSYLADDDLGDLSCPRCEVLNEGLRNESDLGLGMVSGVPRSGSAEARDRAIVDPAYAAHHRFDPQTPPPMFITRDRLLRGFVFGALTTLLAGAAFGAALAAVNFTIPGVAMILVGCLGGAACRSGFGGRAADQSKKRAIAVAALVAVFGMAGFVTGSWGLERFTGDRADQTYDDIDRGLGALITQRQTIDDAGLEVVLDQRILEAERLRRLSSAQIEDYLWTQEAQIRQPLLAYTKLRATRGPVVRLGADSEPVALRMELSLAILVGELILAMVFAARAVMPR